MVDGFASILAADSAAVTSKVPDGLSVEDECESAARGSH